MFKKIFIFSIITMLLIIWLLFLRSDAMNSTPNTDFRPFFITSKPIIFKKISLPKGTKIIYTYRYFWETFEQKKPRSEKDIKKIVFKEEINWGGIPVTSISKFFNPEMTGFTLHFNELNKTKKNQLYPLLHICNKEIGINIKNSNDWSFNKKNILSIQSCGFEKQKYLDILYTKLMKLENKNTEK